MHPLLRSKWRNLRRSGMNRPVMIRPVMNRPQDEPTVLNRPVMKRPGIKFQYPHISAGLYFRDYDLIWLQCHFTKIIKPETKPYWHPDIYPDNLVSGKRISGYYSKLSVLSIPTYQGSWLGLVGPESISRYCPTREWPIFMCFRSPVRLFLKLFNVDAVV